MPGEEHIMGYLEHNRAQKPFSLVAAIAVNGSIIAAIMLSPMVVGPPKEKTKTEVTWIETKAPPPRNKPTLKADPPPFEPIFTPRTPLAPQLPQDPIRTSEEQPLGSAGATAGEGKGDVSGEIVKKIEEIPVIIFKKALRDMRFAKDFQPVYPPSLLVREIEGSATIRVLVGTDGRVREAQVVSATHPDFGKSAVRQALKSWRFKPATRGGEPVEDWVTVPVTFQIN
jgi:periplasmic protein TonB